MVPLYAGLADAHRAGLVAFAQVRAFTLDEYLGLAPGHPASFRRYILDRFAAPLGLQSGRVRTLSGVAADPAGEARACAGQIRAAGGHDLKMLGMRQTGSNEVHAPTPAHAPPTPEHSIP